LAEDQDAAGSEVLVEAGQRESGLLNMWAGDDATDAVGARQQLERQAERFGSAGEQPADGDAALCGQTSRLLNLGVNQRELAVRAAIQHADRRRFDVMEHD